MREIDHKQLRYLNLGCGERFHPGWTNLDLAPSRPEVRRWDVKAGIPNEAGSFDAVYLSHVLEHFSGAEGLRLLGECHRVLRSGGVVRVVVPDLERIARLYLEALEESTSCRNGSKAQYDWMLLELYDQTVREREGGEMLEFVRRASESEREFVRRRLGGELDRMLAEKPATHEPRSQTLSAKARRFVNKTRCGALRALIGREGMRAYDLGRFRMSGEVHRWMYDRYSLARALEESGFASPRAVGAAESRIQGWAEYCLDTEPDGRVYKPDSLYMEAVRP